MALMISEECISCGACEPECPNSAINEGDSLYIVNGEVCTECVGYHDEPQCASVCPVEACVPDPNRRESREQLLAKKETNVAR